jgi:site-specific DNA recombinase
MLRNPIFAGLIALPDGSLIEGAHEAIVPRELWERVQQMHGKVVQANRHHGALLSGLLVCSSCGYKMAHNPGGRARGNGMFRADHYRCASRQRKEACPRQLTVQADIADTFVEELFLSRFDAKRMPNGGRLKPPRQDGFQRQKKQLRARLDEIDMSLDRLADQRFRHRSLPAREYERQAVRFLAEREEVDDQLRDVEASIATVTPLDRTVLDDWHSHRTSVKRRALRLVIGEIRVLPTVRKGKGQAALLPQRLEIGWTQ